MSVSAVASYGSLEARDVLLKDKVVFAGAKHDCKKIALVCEEPSSDGLVNLTLKTHSTDANILTTNAFADLRQKVPLRTLTKLFLQITVPQMQ